MKIYIIDNSFKKLQYAQLYFRGCGRVHPKQIAKMMWRAYDQIKNPPQKLDWDYVEKKEF